MVATQDRTLNVWNGQVTPHVKVAGNGSPVVFFHGAGGLAWDPFLDALAENHTVYAPEHPGTSPGDPDAIKPIDNLWDLVLYYYEVFDQLGLKDPAIVGHSFGGMVAAEVAATNPDRCRKLVLLNPIGLWRDDAPVQNWMIMLPDQLVKVAFADPEGPVAKAMLAAPQDEAAAVEAAIQMTWSMACTGKFVWPIPDKGLKKRLHRITAETLIIWGQKDGLVPPVYAEEFRNRIKNSRVEVLGNSGHMPQLEQPQETARLVQDFLK